MKSAGINLHKPTIAAWCGSAMRSSEVTWRLTALAPLLAGLLLLGPVGSTATAQEAIPTTEAEAAAELAAEAPENAPAEASEPTDITTAFGVDNLFLFLAAVLVLFMQVGFAMLEAGLIASKHTVNILFKNTLDMSVAALFFFLLGYHFMYTPHGASPIVEGRIGAISPTISGGLFETGTPGTITTGTAAGALTTNIHFFYQVALAAVAATIVSGAVAGRMKVGAYLVYTAFISALVYPTIGYWKWGGGWLDSMGFYDFAGSGIVHMTGGFAALAGAIVIGPRIGRFGPDGKPNSMPGHSLPLATLGAFILFIGWFGFTGGNQLKIVGGDNTHAVALIAVNTLLAACAGSITSTVLSWGLFGKADLSMGLNGLLGGLIGVTASCNGITNFESILIGSIAGAIIVGAVITLDKLKIDDPVGAFPVHGVCGMWGLIAAAIFGDRVYWGGPAEDIEYGSMTAQLTGLVSIALTSFIAMYLLFNTLQAMGFLRVSPEEEEKGLNISEQGTLTYHR